MRLTKWIRGKFDPGVWLFFKFLGFFALVSSGLLFMTEKFFPEQERYCRCPDREQQQLEAARLEAARLEEARRQDRVVKRPGELDAEMQQRLKEAERRQRKAVRTPAAERVRRAFEAWEREQAEREAGVRSREEADAVSEPAAEVDR